MIRERWAVRMGREESAVMWLCAHLLGLELGVEAEEGTWKAEHLGGILSSKQTSHLRMIDESR